MYDRNNPSSQHINPSEELVGEYEYECTNCKARGKMTEYTSAGWSVGDMIGRDPANPNYGKCFRCSSNSLRVIRTPVYPSAAGTTGFTKIPQE